MTFRRRLSRLQQHNKGRRGSLGVHSYPLHNADALALKVLPLASELGLQVLRVNADWGDVASAAARSIRAVCRPG